MFADAAEVGRSEIQELVALGCEYIQVDAPELATLVDPRVRDWAERMGFGAERMLTEGIDLINAHGRGHLRRAPGDPPLPRQQRRDVDGQRRLRLHRPGAVRARDGLRRVLPRVRRRPLGLVRAARRRARRQAGRARAGVDQDAARSRPPTSCAGASTRPRASSRASSSASRRSAASPRSPRATRSPRPTRSASCVSSPTPRTPSGVSAQPLLGTIRKPETGAWSWPIRTCKSCSTPCRARSSSCATRRSGRTSIPACRRSTRTGATSSRHGSRRACCSTRPTTWPSSWWKARMRWRCSRASGSTASRPSSRARPSSSSRAPPTAT